MKQVEAEFGYKMAGGCVVSSVFTKTSSSLHLFDRLRLERLSSPVRLVIVMPLKQTKIATETGENGKKKLAATPANKKSAADSNKNKKGEGLIIKLSLLEFEYDDYALNQILHRLRPRVRRASSPRTRPSPARVSPRRRSRRRTPKW